MMVRNTAENTGLRPAWKPGQSGNPGGRPKGPSFKTLLRRRDKAAFAALDAAFKSKSGLIRLKAFEVWANLRYRQGEDKSAVPARTHVIVIKQSAAGETRHSLEEFSNQELVQMMKALPDDTEKAP